MNLKHVVITSVNRDELPDGGAAVWAETIRANPPRNPPAQTSKSSSPISAATGTPCNSCSTKRPRFSITTSKPSRGSTKPSARRPNIHRSLKLLHIAKEQGLVSKTGMMLGLGETEDEIDSVLDDLVTIGCEILTLGQYLQPTFNHLPVERWVHPDEFAGWKIRGEAKGSATSNPARWSAAVIMRKSRCWRRGHGVSVSCIIAV